jgi:hypothetical protein
MALAKSYKWDLTQKNYPVSFKEINEIQQGDEIQLLSEGKEHEETRKLIVKRAFFLNGKRPSFTSTSIPFTLVLSDNNYLHYSIDELAIQCSNNFVFHLDCFRLLPLKALVGKGTQEEPYEIEIDDKCLACSVHDIQKLKVNSCLRIRKSIHRITFIETHKRTFQSSFMDPPGSVSQVEFSWAKFTPPFFNVDLQTYKELIIRSDHADHSFDVVIKYQDVRYIELKDDAKWD